MRFNTFNEVAKWYEQTKPVVSKYHKAEDNVRPIGQRKRKWERIRKVDAETYLLLDGNYGNTMYPSSSRPHHQFEQDMAPIMWKREADGDHIYIRNAIEGHTAMSRYQFLKWYLPSDMAFRFNQAGKHWVFAKTPTGWEDFPLPKTNYRWDSQLHEPIKDDGKRLKFKVNSDGTFTRVGEAFKTEKTNIDKELKKHWKPKIDAFYAQAAALAPMLDTTWHGRNLYKDVIIDWCRARGHEASRYYNTRRLIPDVVAREIVEQEDHELRVPLIALVIGDIDGKREIKSQADMSSIKSAYNRLMNQILGMYETKEV